MADRKRLTANIKFDFSTSGKKQIPLLIVQLIVVLALAIFQITQLVKNGFNWMDAGLLALFVFCGYLMVRNAWRAFNPKAGEKARENAVQMPDFVAPIPESDQNNKKSDD